VTQKVFEGKRVKHFTDFHLLVVHCWWWFCSWICAPYGCCQCFRRFGDMLLLSSGSVLKIETAHASETSPALPTSTWCKYTTESTSTKLNVSVWIWGFEGGDCEGNGFTGCNAV
jgi:hypothetical protein